MYPLYFLSVVNLAVILKKGWEFHCLNLQNLEDELSQASNPEKKLNSFVRNMEGGLPILGVSSRVAPLLGLLGTVIGMIKTFRVIEIKGGQVNVGLLAKGIWEALLTTAFGLVIAIIALIFYHWFLRRVDEVIFILEENLENKEEN